METRIRKARKADIPELAELLKLFREEHSRLIGGDKTVDTKETLKETKTNIEKTARGYFVAELDDGRLIGYRSWELRDEYYFTKELFVKQKYRREGVARKLIRELEDWLKKRDQDSACISCVPQNLAMINLARSEGYTILNQIELRKNLTEDPAEPNEKRNALGYSWEIY
ncbi:MAG: N-acetyltransferase family protein [Candidatus Acetothermia bacterium]